MTIPADPDQLQLLEAHIDRWITAERSANPVVADVARNVDGRRSWFVRLTGVERDSFTVRFHLEQRTLHYETYFMPAPEENEAELFRHLLVRNHRLYGATFAIGDEDAVYLVGQLPNEQINDVELDRILGSMYQWVEQFFRPAMRIGFASKFG
ncbi:MAG: YbjN domain-containing protein [Actinomycetota bacterium]